MDNTHLGEQQVLLLKAMHKRNRPAPFCCAFIFTETYICRFEVVDDLVSRGLIIKEQTKPDDPDLYSLTSDGKTLAYKLH